MTTNMILAAQAQDAGGYSMIIMIVAIFAIMYFFMIRPQQKKQKEIRNFQNSLTEGAKVVTAGGMHGTVKRINTADNIIEIEVAKGVTVSIDRGYVFANAAAQQVR